MVIDRNALYVRMAPKKWPLIILIALKSLLKFSDVVRGGFRGILETHFCLLLFLLFFISFDV